MEPADVSDNADDYCVSLTAIVWKLVPKARTADELFGLAEIIEALARFTCDPEASLIEIDVGVDTGYRVEQNNYEEGLYYSFRVSDDGIRLDKMTTSYSKNIGSDHHSEVLAFIGRDGDISGDPDEWFQQIKKVLYLDESGITISRDHL